MRQAVGGSRKAKSALSPRSLASVWLSTRLSPEMDVNAFDGGIRWLECIQ